MIEISPTRSNTIWHGNTLRRLDHLSYVGSTGTSPMTRDAQHVTGMHPGASGAATPFIAIRRHRDEAGLPGPVVDGEDVWLGPEMTEILTSRADAATREGPLADLLIRQDTV